MTREEAIKVLERISEGTIQRDCSTCGRPTAGIYSGGCCYCSLCEVVPEILKDYHERKHFRSYWTWDGKRKNEALEMAISALRQQERFGDVNKALTLDELSERNAPVFLPIKDFPNGGYWCLCENGYIIPPSGHGFMAKERPNWVFYSQKPEEDDHDERKENENV